MRVLVIVPYVPLRRTSHAGGVATHHLVRGLSESCTVDCLCWGTDEERRALQLDPIRDNVCLILPRGLGLAGSFAAALRCLFREPVATVALCWEMLVAHACGDPYFGHLTVLKALSVVEGNRLIAADRYDVVHVEHSALISVGRFLRHPTKVLLFHDVYQTIVDRRNLTPAARKSVARIERKGWSFYGGLVTVSRKDTEFVAVNSARPVLQIALYVEAPRGKVRQAGNGTVLFFGALDRDVNAQAARFLISEVLPLLRRTTPSVRLLIAGAHPSEDLMRAAAADPEHLRVTGFAEDIDWLFESAEVFACPLFVGGGVIIKALTAMAHGVPLVATGVAMEGIDAVPGVHYLAAETGSQFAEQIERVFTDPGLGRALSDNARRLFEERYDWRKSVDELRRFYDQLCAPAPAP